MCILTSSSPVCPLRLMKTEALWENQTFLLDWEVKGDPVCVSDDEDPPAVTTPAITETNRPDSVSGLASV